MAAELAPSTLNLDNHLLLDQPLLRVPYELHRRTHKTAQRLLEHDKDWLASKLKNTARAAADDPSNTRPTLSSIDDMIKRMETLKRKLSSLSSEEQILHRQSKARLDHVRDLESIHTPADVKYDEWSKVRLDRLLVDYLLRSGYTETAQKLAKSQNISDLVDIDAFIQCQRIETSLKNRETKEALAWCADNKASLKKLNTNIEHELRLQEFIELVRTRNPEKMRQAQLHARKYLTSAENTDLTLRAGGLLALGEREARFEPYASLYAAARWEHLAAMFVKTYHALLSLPQSPQLHIALSAGLSALKTPSCHSSHMSPSSALNANTISSPSPNAAQATGVEANGEVKKPATKAAAIGQSVCPICSTELNALARNVPYAHHSKSIVENNPVALPNGRVYGRERLMAFQSKIRGGESVMEGEEWGDIVDPADVDVTVGVGALRKVYIS